MTDYLVDNSVWARLASGDQAIAARLRRIERVAADLFVTCATQVLELAIVLARAKSTHATASRSPWASRSSARLTNRWYSKSAVRSGVRAWCERPVRWISSSPDTDRDFMYIADVVELQHEYIAPSS